MLDGRRVVRAGHGLGLHGVGDGSRGGLLEAAGSGGGGRVLLSLFGNDVILLFNNVAEDVVKDKVTVGLTSKDKGLGEFFVGSRLVRDLANDLDDNVVVRGLGIDVGDADLAVLEVKLLDAVVDCLERPVVRRNANTRACEAAIDG